MQSPIMLVSSCIYDTYVRLSQRVNRTNMKGQRSLFAHSGPSTQSVCPFSASSGRCRHHNVDQLGIGKSVGDWSELEKVVARHYRRGDS